MKNGMFNFCAQRSCRTCYWVEVGVISPFVIFSTRKNIKMTSTWAEAIHLQGQILNWTFYCLNYIPESAQSELEFGLSWAKHFLYIPLIILSASPYFYLQMQTLLNFLFSPICTVSYGKQTSKVYLDEIGGGHILNKYIMKFCWEHVGIRMGACWKNTGAGWEKVSSRFWEYWEHVECTFTTYT